MLRWRAVKEERIHAQDACCGRGARGRALIVPSTADAAIPQVFTKTATPINCTVQASGQRFCGTGTAQIASWDGMPLDVSVAFPPAPATAPTARSP